MPADDLLARLAPHLEAARAQSLLTSAIDGIPAAEHIRAIVTGLDPSFLAQLSAQDRFLVAEASPQTAAGADPALIAPAYCASLSLVSADWWGTPGSRSSEAGHRLLALGAAALPCLVVRFGDGDPLVYHQGEANTQARDLRWSVADLAASFAAAILGSAYDDRAPVANRREQRNKLRRQTQGGASTL